MSDFLRLDGLTKRFGDLTVLDDVGLGIGEGETLVLLGPSGSGKTTLLRAIAGFERPDEGTVAVGGDDVTELPPARRGFGMVFQHYALFPHLSVGENVAFGLESRQLERRAIATRVDEALALVELAGFADRRVDQISGGQQQRVALARALAPSPRVLLLDEPLSNLDPALRERTRRQIRSAIEKVGITAVWVTHEQEEAFDVGDRIAVLHEGILKQVGSPETLYLEPASPFVATFVGRASKVEGRWREGRVMITAPSTAAPGSEVGWRATAGEALDEGCGVAVYYRPEGLELCAADEASALDGLVEERRYGGAQTHYTVDLGDGVMVEVEGGVEAAATGDRVGVRPRETGPHGIAFAASGEHGP